MTSFQWFADQAPAGRFLCQLCFETKPVAEAWRDEDGQAWDVCRECRAHEEDELDRRKATPMTDIPPRVLAAEARRDFRELLARSSFGCPEVPSCGHLLSEHGAEDYDVDGTPVGARCRVDGCMCGREAA